MCGALWFHWLFSGRLAEGRWWLDRTLRASDAPTQARARALVASAFLAGVAGDLEAADVAASAARDLAEDFGDRRTAAAALTRLASTATTRGDAAEARALLTEVLDRYSALGASDSLEAVFPRNMLVWVFTQEGNRAAACEIGRQSVAICRSWGDETVLSATLVHLARAMWAAGDLTEAAAVARDAVLQRRSMPVPTTLARGVEQLAWIVANRRGRASWERAAVLLGAADRIWREFGLMKLRRAPLYAGPHAECEASVRASLGDDAFETAFRRGADLGVNEIVDYVAGKPTRDQPATAVADPLAALTRREREVAELVAAGLTNRQIAARLVVSLRTAETHVDRIMGKLGCTSRARVAAWFPAREGALRVVDTVTRACAATGARTTGGKSMSRLL